MTRTPFDKKFVKHRMHIRIRILGTLHSSTELGELFTNISEFHKKFRSGLSSRQLYYHLQILRNGGHVIYDRGWKVTLAGRNLLSQFTGYPVGTEIVTRSHNLTFKFDMIQRPDFDPNDFKFSVMKGWKFPQAQCRLDPATLLRITDNHLIFHLSNIITRDAVQSLFLGFVKCKHHLQELLEKYPVLKAKCPILVDVSTQHHAINNKYIKAKLVELSEKFNIRYKSDRLVIDRSLGFPEIETVHPQHADGDFSRLTEFFELVIRGKFDPKKIMNLGERVAALEQKQTPVQKEGALFYTNYQVPGIFVNKNEISYAS